MAQHYGRVTLNKNDLEYLATGLQTIAKQMLDKARQATDADEVAFYEAASDACLTGATQLAGKSPGRLGFSEMELNTLRSVLSFEVTAALVREYQDVRATDPVRTLAIAAELDYRQQLGHRLERPFRLDRSQDPELEDDEQHEIDAEDELELAGAMS
jgi:hypothetical protein